MRADLAEISRMISGLKNYMRKTLPAKRETARS